MTHYGKITHFDKDTGTGMISATDGGGALPFMASGMREEPRSDQTYRFETETNPDGRLHAVNLTMDDVTPSFPPAGIRAGRLFCASARLKQWAA